MSRARHKTKGKAAGGKVMEAGGNPEVLREAKEKKHGGAAMAMEGKKGRHRLDRRGRASGGRVGADRAPLSSAHSSVSARSADD